MTEVHSDQFWRADTGPGRVIQKVAQAAIAATPRRLAHMVGAALDAAGYRLYNVNDMPPPGKPGGLPPGAPAGAVGPKLTVVPLRQSGELSPTNQRVVQLLEDALRDARLGNVAFVALTAVGIDGSVQPAWAGDYKPLSALAAVADLRIRFEAAYVETTNGQGAA